MRWDLFIRLFHWSLASGIVANYLLLEEGETLHEWVGYVVCALVVFRLLWGFMGPTRARFSAFLKSPSAAFHEMTELASPHTLPNTHTALGGYQLVLVLALVISVGLTGWMQDLDAFWGEDWPQDLHELLANALILVACLHVAGVLWIHFALKTPLLHRMWFGRNDNTKVGTARDV